MQHVLNWLLLNYWILDLGLGVFIIRDTFVTRGKGLVLWRQ